MKRNFVFAWFQQLLAHNTYNHVLYVQYMPWVNDPTFTQN